jgi:hypothetical protein
MHRTISHIASTEMHTDNPHPPQSYGAIWMESAAVCPMAFFKFCAFYWIMLTLANQEQNNIVTQRKEWWHWWKCVHMHALICT